jgi:xylulokinase
VETGLPTTAIVAAGGHDHVCGAFAAGVTEPGTMLNSIGTAEAVFIPLERPIADPRAGREGYTQGAHVVGGRPYVFGGLYTSGASIEWLRQILVPELAADNAAAYAALIAAAETVAPGSLGVCFLPHLRLANPPADDPKSRGVFVGLTTDTTRGALARAVFEGLAFESRHTLEGLLVYPEVVAPRAIAVISGGARNRLLMRIKATVVNQTHTVIHLEEATALGAALLGGLGAGVYSDVPAVLASLRYERTPVVPVAEEVALYEAIYREVYRRLYESVAPLSHAIVDLQSSLGPTGG